MLAYLQEGHCCEMWNVGVKCKHYEYSETFTVKYKFRKERQPVLKSLIVQGWAGYQLPEQWLMAWGSRVRADLPIRSVEMGVLGLAEKVANNLQSPFHSIAAGRRVFFN